MKHTNKNLLLTGMKYLAGSLPLVILGPSLVYSALNNKSHTLHYMILALGILLMLIAVALMFIGIRKAIKAVFD